MFFDSGDKTSCFADLLHFFSRVGSTLFLPAKNTYPPTLVMVKEHNQLPSTYPPTPMKKAIKVRMWLYCCVRNALFSSNGWDKVPTYPKNCISVLPTLLKK